jgi:ubiquinone/menaquinone biosynthesis C-methylase UbiE
VKRQLKEKADDSFWDQIWLNYDIENAFELIKYYKTYNIVLKNISKEKPILEAGCGISQWVYSLHKENYNIRGIDYAKKTVSIVNKKYPELNVKYGDIFDLNFKNSSIGTYLSWGVMEHYEEGPYKILSEAKRVLMDDGKIIITVPYLNILRRIFILSNEFGRGSFYQFIYKKNEFIKILESSGFRVLQVHKLNWIKGIKDLIFKEKNNLNTISNVKKSNNSFFKKIIKIILIKIENLSLLTSISGHMIMFVAEKKLD